MKVRILNLVSKTILLFLVVSSSAWADLYCVSETGAVSGLLSKNQKAITRVLEPGKNVIEVKPGTDSFGDIGWQLSIDGIQVLTCKDQFSCYDFSKSVLFFYDRSRFFYKRYEASKRWDFMKGIDVAEVQMVGTCYTDSTMKHKIK